MKPIDAEDIFFCLSYWTFSELVYPFFSEQLEVINLYAEEKLLIFKYWPKFLKPCSSTEINLMIPLSLTWWLKD